MARKSTSSRKATINRKTGETGIRATICIDGSGRFDVDTGSRMFDHMLSHIAQHGLIDITIKASGWDQHHLVEDVAIALGQALNTALGDKQGIIRMGHAVVPMDEALASVVVDLSGRGYAVLNAPFRRKKIGDMESDMVLHFLNTFATEAKMNLHVDVRAGDNDHHKAEAIFKALGRALDAATRIDPRLAGRVPSTKGMIQK